MENQKDFTIVELIKFYREIEVKFNDFVKLHEKTIGEYEILQNQREALMNEIKHYARTNEISVDMDDRKVIVTQPYKKWIDYEVASSLLNEEQKQVLDSMTNVTHEVDMQKFIRACRDGRLPSETQIKAYKEHKLTPRVSIETYE